jgi:membrane protease YdiL (CAAX protease family)
MATVETGADATRRGVLRELNTFFALTFVITWGLGAALIFARPEIEKTIGHVADISHHWLYYLAVTSPTISAVICSLVFGGWRGLVSLASRLVRSFNPLWIAVAILIWPLALAITTVAFEAAGRHGSVDLHALVFVAPVIAVTTLILLTDPGGFGEELGWRGYALPRLLVLMPPLPAAIFLGLIWGVWHLPAFFVSDLSQSKFGFGWFLIGTVSLSILMTWLYLHANGNVIVAGTIPHLTTNLLFDAHVYLHDAVVTEAFGLGTLAVVLIAVSGVSLTREPRPKASNFSKTPGSGNS